MERKVTRRAVMATAALVPVAAIRCAAQNPNQPRSLTPAQRRTTEMCWSTASFLTPMRLAPEPSNAARPIISTSRWPITWPRKKDAWVAGLAALDAIAMESQGSSFAELSAEKRDAVLMVLPQNLQAFFNQARTYTLQGTFGDPHYGGNIDGKGWDIIRYPGPRPATSPDMQRMDKEAEPYRKSAWGNQ